MSASFDHERRMGITMIDRCLEDLERRLDPAVEDAPVSYTHLTLPTIYSV